MSETGAGPFNDESIKSDGGHVIVFKPEYPKESQWKQPSVYIAILALIVSGFAWLQKDWAVEDVKADARNYRNDISVWETDVFNRDKTIEAILVAHGIDMSKVGKLKPPPER